MIGFAAAVLVLVGLAIFAITWYAKGSYFVGVKSGNVTIFRGRPGGFLWVDPTVADRTDLRLDDVPPSRRSQLREGQPEPTMRAARRYIANLQDEANALQATTTTTVVDPSATTLTTIAP
jgi:protein phosphatase